MPTPGFPTRGHGGALLTVGRTVPLARCSESGLGSLAGFCRVSVTGRSADLRGMVARSSQAQDLRVSHGVTVRYEVLSALGSARGSMPARLSAVSHVALALSESREAGRPGSEQARWPCPAAGETNARTILLLSTRRDYHDSVALAA